MKTLLTAALALGAAAAARADEPGWDKKKAAARLDERAKWWMGAGTAQRATDAAGKVACLCCHTTAPYALARPGLAPAAPLGDTAPLDRLLKDVDRRLVAWPTMTEMYGNPRKEQSRGTEAVLSAVMLAWNDAARGEAAPTEATRRALDRLWETQRKDGGWDWLQFPLEPWETKDAEYIGAALAALAVGTAPGYYAGKPGPGLEKQVEALRGYLKGKRNKDNYYAETWLLLASTKLNGLLTPEEQAAAVETLKGMQRKVDGGTAGWVLLEFNKWRYNNPEPPAKSPELSPAAKNPDGYATALVTYTLLRAGVKPDDPKVAAGLAWLRKNQQPDGSWPAVSINRVRDADDFAVSFMSDAATAWAVLALLEAEAAAKN